MTAAAGSTPAFRDLLREARKAKGWTQQIVADRAGVSKAHVCDLESGNRTPSDAACSRLAAVLGLNPIDLFFSLGRIAPSLWGRADVLAAVRGVGVE